MNIKSILLFCATAFLFSSCKKDIKTITQKDKNDRVIAEYQIRVIDSAKQGKFIGYYEDGNKFEESNYVDNVLHGERTIFFKTGEVKTKENHVRGTFAGRFTEFYKNGKVKEEGEYSNAAMNGEWKFYYPEGQLKEIVNFVENDENGPFKEFHKNGKLSAEGTYQEGDNEVGELKKYDEKGKLIEKMNCRVLELAGNKFSKCNSVWKASK